MKGLEPPRLSGAVIVKNEVDRIADCIRSLGFCDEIIAVDTGSTDGTLEVLRGLGIEPLELEFENFARAREAAREAATGVWILYLDADEIITQELASEIRATLGAEKRTAGYRVRRRNHYGSVWLKYGGYYPDYTLRLFRREAGSWDLTRSVHERVLLEGVTRDLSGHIDHFSFESLSESLAKAQRYAEMAAEAMFRNGRRASAWAVAGHTAARFARSYVVKRGFLAGGLGFVLAGVQAYETFQKYSRLWELSRIDRRPS